jgi:uncharacterized damage-inducible protein DinB
VKQHPSMLERLFAHLRWADQAIVDAIRREVHPPREAIELFAHILGAEHVWLSRLQGTPSDYAVWPALSIEETAALAKSNSDAFGEWLAVLDDARLSANVRYQNSAGATFESRVDDILLHVALHGQYHRGQVNLLLRQAGANPAPVDFIAYVRGAPAATRR